MASEIRKVFVKRLFHAALLVLTLLLPAACKAQTAAEDPCVFIGEEIALPDGWHPLAAVCPYAGEHGITALCSDGEKYALFSYDPDAEEGAWTRTEGDFPKAASLIGGTVTEDAVFLVSAEEGFGAFTLTRYGTDGAAEKTVSLDTFFGAVDPMRFGIYAVAATDRGDCALSGGEKIVCLDAEMNLSFSVSCGGEALGLAFDSAGDLVALFPGEDCFRQLDGNTGAVKKTISGAARAKKLFRSADGGICFTDSVGVKRFSEKGEHSPMLDYLNSNLTAQTTSVLGVCHEDAVLLLRGGAESRLCLYRRSDEPVSWGSTLEIAVTQESSVLSNAIRVFSARHGDIHITLTDYSQYNTKDDWQAGQKRLALDLTTGVYKPDLIYAPASDIEMQTAIRENFYVDLMPFFERDDKLNPSTVFGAAVRSVGDEKGGLWGMCCGFAVHTLVSTRTLLEKYGVPDSILGKEGMLPARSWTLDEMLDFLEALPDGILPLYNLTAENADNLTGSGFAAFIDFENMTCDFTSPTVIRFFRYLTTLPRNMEELERTSEFWQLPDSAGAERGAFFTDGRIVMRSHSLNKIEDFMRLEALFNAKDYVTVGYPTPDDYGIVVQPMDSFLVTTYCSSPASAWELIKTAMTTPVTNRRGETEWANPYPPSLKQTFVDMAEKQKEMTTVYYFDGRTTSTNDPETAQRLIRELEDGKPGLLLTPTDGDIAAACELFDSIGKPWMMRLDDTVKEIIDEEISDMLGGVTSPEKCAERVQSRVSIWLAEHE